MHGDGIMDLMKKAIPATTAAMFVLLLLVPYRDAHAGGVHVSVSGAVVVAPALPQVYVVPAPPPVVIMPLPPPPPPVVVQPTPVVVVKQAPAAQVLPPGPPAFYRKVGLGLKLNGAIHSMETKHHEGMGGAGLLLRMRLRPHLALELSLDAVGGKGYGGAERLEIPATMALMWYPGRHWSVVQPYLLAGFGAAWAKVGENPHADHPVYIGGLAGIGLELRLGSKIALFAEARGFIRQRMNDRSDDPLVPTDGSCKSDGKCTNTEGGGISSLGIIAYF